MIAYRSRFILESFQRRVGAQVALFGAQTGKLLKRGLHQALRVPLRDLAFGIGMVLGEQTRPVQVQVRIQVMSAAIIDWFGTALRAIAVAEDLASDRFILSLGQGPTPPT